ncbi:MAG: hypothetical protein Q9184_002825 [Pyrenodesmia sp. 2 TL-2023]
MVYDWEGREGTMRALYIDQNKSLEEVMDWFRANQNFTPSKRAFQTQIKRWNFPPKHTPAYTDSTLVNRVRQLWAQNVSQKNMLEVLHGEGFDAVTERELTRVRDKEGLKLRVATTRSTPNEKSSIPTKRKHDEHADQDLLDGRSPQAQFPVQGATPENNQGLSAESPMAPLSSASPSGDLTEEVIQKRQARFERLQAESQERLEKRTRRRRTKSYAGLPPDPPAPPRFPSETTLEEAKSILHLDKSMYIQIRAKFEEICLADNVIKKTEAGPDKWQAVKNQLIEQFPPIQPMFLVTDQAQLNYHYLALEMICNDVTKKLRTMKSKVTIADAKNALGLNPEQGRQIKAVFHRILKEDHFTSKIETGPDHWHDLKQKWINELPLLQHILAAGDADPNHGRKLKAMEHLCRDVMKRLRDTQTKEQKRRIDGGAAEESASPHVANINVPPGATGSIPRPKSSRHASSRERNNRTDGPAPRNFDGISTLASQALASAPLPISPPLPNRYQHVHSSHNYSGQIDPTLLSAAANLPMYQSQQPPFLPTAVYFRLAPNSQVKSPPNVWVETLPSPNVTTLRQLAVASRPYANLSVGRIEGLIKADTNDSKLTIKDDEELMAYMQHLKGDSPTFVVHISYES